MNGDYVHIYLDPTTARLFEKAIEITKKSKSGLVREALKEKFEKMGLKE